MKAVPGFTKQIFAMAAFRNFQDKKEFTACNSRCLSLNAYRIWLEYSKGYKEYLAFIADEDEDHLKTEDLNSGTFHLIFREIRKMYP